MPLPTKMSQDMRCRVGSRLKSLLADSDGILPRESWMKFLHVIVRSQDTQALLKDQKTHLSVEEFLDIIFGPKESVAPEVSVSSAVLKGGEIAWTDNLRDYFGKLYRKGGEFRHPDYKDTYDVELHTWLHQPTGIQIWRDAIDLTSGEGGEVYFHYTSDKAFRNITAAEKKAAEVWASLNSDPGPEQNAWWGKGVYSVPLPPDQWRDCHQLLDNNFRNMMARDRAAPDKGLEYVESEYPKRVAFCVPIITYAADAYDVSVRATPEMETAGKEPGRNLRDMLLNDPGMPQRCCVVLRVNGEDGVKHAQGQLLHALQRRAASLANPAAKERFFLVLWSRGLFEEALPVAQELLWMNELIFGPQSHQALSSKGNLANLLADMGDFNEALELERQVVEAMELMHPPEHRERLAAMNNLAETLSQMGQYGEAMFLHQQVLKIRIQSLGAEHPATSRSMNNLAGVLCDMGKYHDSANLYKKALEIRERTLGAEHPETLSSMADLALVLTNLGNFAGAKTLQRKALEVRESILGAQHFDTLSSLSELAVTLHRLGELNEAMDMQRHAVSGREEALGPDHSDTKEAQKRLQEVLRDLEMPRPEDR